MPFTDLQKKAFHHALQAKGWVLHDGVILSPSGALWFDSSHFEDWSPTQMNEIFIQRAERIAMARLGDWQARSRDNQDAALAAAEVARNSN